MTHNFWFGRVTPIVAVVAASAAITGASAQTLANYKPTPNDWASFGYDLAQTRHVPFTDINPGNVKDLGLAYEVDFQKADPSPPGGQQSYVLAMGGKIFATTSFNHVFAVDAATGRIDWHFVPSKLEAFKNFGVPTNRGLAFCEGKLFMQTLDMRILALDPDKGTLVQEKRVYDDIKDAKPQYGYYQSSAPTCAWGNLFVGAAGADNGIRGYVMAFKAKDLSPAWADPHWNVPPEGQDWRSHGRFHGGGATWMPVTVDEKTHRIYFSSSNPSPDFFPALRPGLNPNTNALIAAAPADGADIWVRQQEAPDEGDYDTAQSPMVYDAKVGGVIRRVASVGSKNGRLYVYDAATGAPIYDGVQIVKEIIHPTLVPGQDMQWAPTSVGGISYATSAFDPKSNILVVSAIESKGLITQSKTAADVEKDRVRGDVDMDSYRHYPPGWKNTGSVSGVDLNTGKVAWRLEMAEPDRGGTTTTASGLAFTGGGDGVLRALDTATGKVLWSFQTGAPIAAAPSIFRWQGVEYVALATGGSFTTSGGGKVSRLAVFRLGGDKTQMAPPPPMKGPPVTQLDRAEGTASANPLARYLLTDDPVAPGKLSLLLESQPQVASGMNFNGYSKGGMTITVQKGTPVYVTFRNASSDMPHSVVVTDWDHREASVDFPLPFPDAHTAAPGAGITSGTDNFSFVADKTGVYAIVCGVPGHATLGMWITLKVVDAGPARIETKDGGSYTVPAAAK